MLGTRRTYWNDELEGYYALIGANETLNYYADTETYQPHPYGPAVTTSVNHYVGGNIIDLLAEYEDTGLTPKEIKRLKYTDIKNLQASNDMLRKNNDEYYVAYQKLLNENKLLKQMLKTTLEKEIG